MRELFDDVVQHIESYAISSFFVNGAPGVGKSYLLSELGRTLPDAISGCVVLPHYELTTVEEFCKWLIEQLEKKGIIENVPENDYLRTNLDVLWQWLSDKITLSKNQTLVLLLDIGYVHYQPDESIATLFSVVSALDSHHWNCRLHHTIVGFWNHEALSTHFFEINSTFPYEVGGNYRLFSGVDESIMASLLPQSSYPQLHGSLLYEITGGHLGAASAIAEKVKKPSLESILNAVHEVAKKHEVTHRLLSVWKQMPYEALELLEGLLTHRHLLVSANSKADEHLLSAGIARRIVVDKQVYLRFQSWYIELALRYHADELNLRDRRLADVDVTNLSPILTSLNDEAYRLIRDIEVSARNFVSIRLSLTNKNNNGNILAGINKRIEDGQLMDTDTRTRQERDRIQSYRLSVKLNPQISYMTTGELAQILQEIGRNEQDKAWSKIGDSIQKMASIRNAVMHNQLVDEQALRTLYDLRGAIYRALNR